MDGDAETLVYNALRGHFKAREATEIATELQPNKTVGQGHFGRVRLVESVAAREALAAEELVHSGWFAQKIMKKSEIIRLKQQQHVHDERMVLVGSKKLKNPFIATAYHTYQDERSIFLLMEYVPGGELARRLDDGILSNLDARFYAAQIVMALQYMHSEHIIYRGLVTDNILIDRQGYVKLVDFGFAKQLVYKDDDEKSGKTFTLCGTPEYLAPEIVSTKGHGKGADWWALGILIFEMLAGYPPFYAAEPYEIYTKILKGEYKPPKCFDQQVTALTSKLLMQDVAQRLGCKAQGAEEIKKHKWFRGLDWARLYNKQMLELGTNDDGARAFVWVPKVSDDPADTSRFDTYPDSLEEVGPLLSDEKQSVFAYWA